MSKKLSYAGLGLVIAGLLFFIARAVLFHGAADEDAPVAAGSMAADFKLASLSGQPVSLSALRGKVVFLNIWATWCGPCREEMPSMETLYEAMKSRKDFVMLAVSEDRSGRDSVVPYIKKTNYKFDVLLDPQNLVGDAYNVTGVPESFIIDRSGRIVAHHMGAFDWSRDDVRQALVELLAAKQG